jgi:hypothetical protein
MAPGKNDANRLSVELSQLGSLLRKIFQGVCPPVVYHVLRTLKKASVNPIQEEHPENEMLFDGDDTLFKRTVADAETYAEYGCGRSTVWVFDNTNCIIVGVDTSNEWLANVRQRCATSDRVILHHADVGKVGKWGTPLTYDKCQNFSDYTDWLWNQGAIPDVVLVDGRFRVCCFLTSLVRGREGTRILFDDYTDRGRYHIVERFVKPVRTCGRQALFVVPRKDQIELNEVGKMIERFRFVLD